MIYAKDQYYEAILQIRPKNKGVLDFVKELIDKRNDTFISKEKENKYGYDLYLTSQKFAQIIGRKLKKAFKGELKISRKLYGRSRQTSRIVYRLTVCFRLKKDL